MKSIFKKLLPQAVINYIHLIEAIIAVIVYRYPAKKLTIIGVTGTDGKTTTSNFIYQILKANGKKVGLISTIGAFIGHKKIEVGLHVTSPSPWLLQKIMKLAVENQLDYLVLEVTSHGLDQYRTWGSRIQYAVITTITPEHLDYHKTIDAYAKTKSKILKEAKVAVINTNYLHLLPSHILRHCHIIEYDVHKPTPYTKPIQRRFPQTYNQANALAAALMCEVIGLDSAQVTVGLKQISLVTGRLEYLPRIKNIDVVIDFAHTPNALLQVLVALRQKIKGKLIAVYGSAGLRDAFKRPEMGWIGSTHADLVVFTSEDPRTENADSIIYQMKSGVINNHHKITSITDRQQAIKFAITKLAKSGDTVAILGKGHETSMNLDGKSEIPWSDYKVAEKALELRHD